MKMERARIGSPKKLQTNLLCIPKLKNSKNSSSPNKATAKGLSSPMTALLERLREAVFRLIMLSALSSSTTTNNNNYNNRAAGGAHHDVNMNSPASSYGGGRLNRYDNSEAVADCIEFIKKKAGPDEMIGRESTASSSRDSTSEAGEMCHV